MFTLIATACVMIKDRHRLTLSEFLAVAFKKSSSKEMCFLSTAKSTLWGYRSYFLTLVGKVTGRALTQTRKTLWSNYFIYCYNGYF